MRAYFVSESQRLFLSLIYIVLLLGDLVYRGAESISSELLQKNLRYLFLCTFFYHIIIYSYCTKNILKNIMNNTNFSDTQSSQISRQEDQPPLAGELNYLSEQIDPEQAKQILKRIAENIKTAKTNKIQQLINAVIKLLSKGYAVQIFKYSEILIAMQKQFCSLCRQIGSDSKAQGKMIFVLSTIAQLIRQAGKCPFPFSEKFLKSLFLIDEELLEASPYKDSILAVLGVVYENLSKQGKLLNKYGMVKDFKKVILTNYRLVSESFSARFFNKCLYNLAMQGCSLTQAELYKYKVFETLSKFLAPAQVSGLIQKIKDALLEVNKKKIRYQEPKTQMIAQI